MSFLFDKGRVIFHCYWRRRGMCGITCSYEVCPGIERIGRKVRIVAADIKDIPPPPPLLLTNERDRSLLQLRQSHLLISAALIIHYPRPPTLRTNLDPTFANPCYKSFHSPPRFRFRCYVVTDYMREGINSEIDSSFSVVFYSFKKKNLLG